MLIRKWTSVLHTSLSCLLLFCGNAASAVSSQDSIVLAWENIPRSLDPRYAVDADSQYLENLVHCSLIEFDRDGNTVPSLAESWNWVKPNLLEMKLKKAFFSNAKELVAADVKKTFEFFLRKDLKVPTPRAGAFDNVSSVEVKGNLVSFLLKDPDASFISNLTVGVLPAEFVADEPWTQETLLKKPLPGCGPFSLKEQSLNGIILERNPHYSLAEPAKVKQVEIKIVKDESTRFAKLLGAEVDVVQNGISLEKLSDLLNGKEPKLKVLRHSGLKTTYIGFNVEDKILKDVRVRQAISQGVNREAMIKFIYKDLAKPAKTILLPTSPFYSKQLVSAPYDPKKAEEILDKAGYKRTGPKKARFSLSYKIANNPIRLAVAHAFAQDMKKIGIEIKIEMLEWGRFKEDVDKGRVQMWGLTWIGFKDPDIYRYAFFSKNFPPEGVNRGRFVNASLDELLEKGRKTTEEKARKEIYEKVQSLVNDQLPYAFLFHEENFSVVRREVEGLEVYADGRYSSLRQAYKKPIQAVK